MQPNVTSVRTATYLPVTEATNTSSLDAWDSILPDTSTEAQTRLRGVAEESRLWRKSWDDLANGSSGLERPHHISWRSRNMISLDATRWSGESGGLVSRCCGWGNSLMTGWLLLRMVELEKTQLTLGTWWICTRHSLARMICHA